MAISRATAVNLSTVGEWKMAPFTFCCLNTATCGEHSKLVVQNARRSQIRAVNHENGLFSNDTANV